MGVLKRSGLTPSTQFLAPSVTTLEKTEDTATDSFYIQRGEASLILPDATADLAPTSGAEQLSNSTAWLGCIVAPGSLMAGARVELLSDVASAEECCRACREWPDSACNVWNACLQPGGCRCACAGQPGPAFAGGGYAQRGRRAPRLVGTC